MKGRTSRFLDSLSIAGGSLDGSGNAEIHRARWPRDELELRQLWDLFQDVPALELPEGYSVLDEYR
jgi:oleate hydratase